MSAPLDGLIARFLHDRRADGKAKGTCTTQGMWLRMFASAGLTMESWNESQVRSFMQAQEEAGKRPRTRRSALLSLRAFGRWMMEQHLCATNPAEAVRMPRLDPARRKTAVDREIFAMLDACDKYADSRRAALAKAVVAVLTFGGLRRNELLCLRVHHIDLKERAIHVIEGKGGKSRAVFVPAECVQALDRWLLLRGDAPRDYLFLTHFDRTRRLGDEGLRVLLKEVRAMAGLKESAHLLPHTFRHNYATRLLQAGADLASIQASLGHASIVTTAVYLHSSPEQLRKVADLSARPAPPPTPSDAIRPPAPPEPNGAWRRRIHVRR